MTNIVPENSVKSRYIEYVIYQNPECIKTWISRPKPNWLPRYKYLVKLRQDNFMTNENPDPELTNIVPENSAKSQYIVKIQNPECIETWISRPKPNWLPRYKYLVKLRQGNFMTNENQTRDWQILFQKIPSNHDSQLTCSWHQKSNTYSNPPILEFKVLHKSQRAL